MKKATNAIYNSLLSPNSSLANSVLLPGPLYRRLWFESRSAYLLRKHSRLADQGDPRTNDYHKRMMSLYLEDIELEAKRMIKECSCRECKHRTPTCHGTCKEYLTWKEAYELERKRIQERIRSERIAQDDYHKARRRRKR